ncbi:hypothetical protein H4R33_005407 [Dimargaris cristalligena]|nr:hypothetical protein H4R33_005407 [Dimargaris cristalligena]
MKSIDDFSPSELQEFFQKYYGSDAPSTAPMQKSHTVGCRSGANRGGSIDITNWYDDLPSDNNRFHYHSSAGDLSSKVSKESLSPPFSSVYTSGPFRDRWFTVKVQSASPRSREYSPWTQPQVEEVEEEEEEAKVPSPLPVPRVHTERPPNTFHGRFYQSRANNGWSLGNNNSAFNNPRSYRNNHSNITNDPTENGGNRFNTVDPEPSSPPIETFYPSPTSPNTKHCHYNFSENYTESDTPDGGSSEPPPCVRPSFTEPWSLASGLPPGLMLGNQPGSFSFSYRTGPDGETYVEGARHTGNHHHHPPHSAPAVRRQGPILSPEERQASEAAFRNPSITNEDRSLLSRVAENSKHLLPKRGRRGRGRGK